jgi:hypothetical protein
MLHNHTYLIRYIEKLEKGKNERKDSFCLVDQFIVKAACATCVELTNAIPNPPAINAPI